MCMENRGGELTVWLSWSRFVWFNYRTGDVHGERWYTHGCTHAQVRTHWLFQEALAFFFSFLAEGTFCEWVGGWHARLLLAPHFDLRCSTHAILSTLSAFCVFPKIYFFHPILSFCCSQIFSSSNSKHRDTEVGTHQPLRMQPPYVVVYRSSGHF